MFNLKCPDLSKVTLERPYLRRRNGSSTSNATYFKDLNLFQDEIQLNFIRCTPTITTADNPCVEDDDEFDLFLQVTTLNIYIYEVVVDIDNVDQSSNPRELAHRLVQLYSTPLKQDQYKQVRIDLSETHIYYKYLFSVHLLNHIPTYLLN